MGVVLETGTLLDVELDAIRLENDYEMEDVCRIYKISVQGILQPDGSMSPDVETEIYSGICSITPIIARRDRFDEFGQGLVYSVQYRLTIPWDSSDIHITHLCTITTSRDPEFVGRVFEVRDVHRTSDISQRRITLHDLAR